jgi:hypothetical protein
MPASASAGSQPPQPPDFERRFQLFPFQKVAIPLLLLVPLLALFGIFGETTATAASHAESLTLEVDYPDRMHSGMGNELSIQVINTGTQDLPTVQVEIPQSYLASFDHLQFTPDVTQISNRAATIELHDLIAGSSQFILIRFDGLWVGSHTGEIVARAETAEVSIEIRTFVFP